MSRWSPLIKRNTLEYLPPRLSNASVNVNLTAYKDLPSDLKPKYFSNLTIIAIIATLDLTIIAIIVTSDLTIIAIIATQRKNAVERYIFSSSLCYIIYKLKANR